MPHFCKALFALILVGCGIWGVELGVGSGTTAAHFSPLGDDGANKRTHFTEFNTWAWTWTLNLGHTLFCFFAFCNLKKYKTLDALFSLFFFSL